MNFAEFQKFRDRVLREHPAVLDCAETNLYAALDHLIPPATPAPEHTVHRCHLATQWAQRFGFSAEESRRAMISCGVRNSLSLLFSHYAARNAHLWIPKDNYPVYGELARAAGLMPQEFPTLPEPVWPGKATAADTELLLITNPLKPLGRWLTASEVAALTEWLRGSPERRLLLDAVYTFDTQFHATTLQLLATGQTILLHSLTKGWLQPRLFGVAFVPETDVESLAPVFRAQPPPQSNLARARELLARYAEMPSAVARQTIIARERMTSVLSARVPDLPNAGSDGYFQPIALRWSDLLENAKVLGLPATVFGSSREDITILSSLSFVAPVARVPSPVGSLYPV